MPDTVKVNFVQSVPGRRRGIRIKPVSYPLVLTPSAPPPSTPNISSCGDEEDMLSNCEAEVVSEVPDQEQSGSHRARKERAAEAWAEARSKITPAIISTFGVVCICNSSPIKCVWCPDCGSNAFLCEECAMKLHTAINRFHSPLLWKIKTSTLKKYNLDILFLYRKKIVCIFHFEGRLLLIVPVNAQQNIHEK